EVVNTADVENPQLLAAQRRVKIKIGGCRSLLIEVDGRQGPRLGGYHVTIQHAFLRGEYRHLGLLARIVEVNAVQRWRFDRGGIGQQCAGAGNNAPGVKDTTLAPADQNS